MVTAYGASVAVPLVFFSAAVTALGVAASQTMTIVVNVVTVNPYEVVRVIRRATDETFAVVFAPNMFFFKVTAVGASRV